MKMRFDVRFRQSSVLLSLTILAASMLVAEVANAKAAPSTRAVNTRANGGSEKILDSKSPVNRRRTSAPKASRTELTKRLLEKCGYPLTIEDSAGVGWWRCFRGCLADAGVATYGLIMCGTACAAAWTGAGALVCAMCTGISVTVIEVCALGCAAYPDGYKGPGHYSLILTKNLKRRPPQQRAARVQTAAL